MLMDLSHVFGRRGTKISGEGIAEGMKKIKRKRYRVQQVIDHAAIYSYTSWLRFSR